MATSATVLIVHTNTDSAEQFKALIEGVGLNCCVLTGSHAAGQSIRILQPDIVLLDASLSLADPTVCHRLRLSSPGKRLPIILLIPQGIADISSYLCGVDVDDYLCQPCAAHEVQARIMLRLSASNRKPTISMPHVDFAFLKNLSHVPISELTGTEILQRVVGSITEVIDVSRCSVTMVRDSNGFASVMASSDDLGVNGLRIDLERYPEIQETIRTGQPLLIEDVLKHPLLESVRPSLEHLGFNSLLVLPMIDRQQTIGVLVLRAARSVSGFSEEEVSFCQLVANVATSALCLAELRGTEDKVGQRRLLCGRSERAGDGDLDHSTLLSMAAHDLRVLVSIVDGYCLLLNETESVNLSSEQDEIVNGLMAGNRRLVDMANDLLDFSQLNAGRFELKMAELDICQVLASVCGDLMPLLVRRNIKLQTDCLAREVLTICDERGVRRVFYNIVGNALKFTPDGGQIKLEVMQSDGETRVTVEDNGPGIEPEQISLLFDEFMTASSAGHRAGNGLGLSICKKIVEAHRGRIWAESILGQGSRFTFCLPQ